MGPYSSYGSKKHRDVHAIATQPRGMAPSKYYLEPVLLLPGPPAGAGGL